MKTRKGGNNCEAKKCGDGWVLVVLDSPNIIQMLTSQQKLHSLLRKSTPTLAEREQILKLIRVGRYDLPDCVFESTFELLKANSSSKNRFNHTSELIQSSLELKIGAKVKGYLQKLKHALGEVPYVRKLAALADFVGSTEPSDDVFEDLLIEDRTNYDSRKQSLTTSKVNYQWDDYVRALNDFLKENPNDLEAWMQLGDLYTEKSQYLRALFCYEEVILLSPDNDYYFLRLAELYHTNGGKQDLPVATKYFSYVVSRNPQNVRALWGLWRTLWVQREGLEEQDRLLMEKVRESISKLYSRKNPGVKLHLAL